MSLTLAILGLAAGSFGYLWLIVNGCSFALGDALLGFGLTCPLL